MHIATVQMEWSILQKGLCVQCTCIPYNTISNPYINSCGRLNQLLLLISASTDQKGCVTRASAMSLKQLLIQESSTTMRCWTANVFSGLKQILPDSAILTAVEQVKKSSSYPPLRKLPAPLTSLQDVKYQQMDDAELKAVCNDMLIP